MTEPAARPLTFNAQSRIRCAHCRPSARVGLIPVMALWLAIAALASVGCGYVVGSSFRPEIRTIHVPIFTSDSFRRGVEFQLTEAVHKEIQKRTHYRLTKEPYADVRLTGHIVQVTKNVLGESAFDDPRELQLQYAVEVIWEDLRSGQIIAQERLSIGAEIVQLASTSDFAPEVGQSLATATHAATDRLARQIVDLMEAPW